jgi:hypothetical protein
VLPKVGRQLAHFFAVAPAPHPCGPLSSSALRLPLPTPAASKHHLAHSLSRRPKTTAIHCKSAFSLAEASPSTDWYAASPDFPVSRLFSTFWRVGTPYCLASTARFPIEFEHALLTVFRVYRSLSLDRTPSASALFRTPWVRSPPRPKVYEVSRYHAAEKTTSTRRHRRCRRQDAVVSAAADCVRPTCSLAARRCPS